MQRGGKWGGEQGQARACGNGRQGDRTPRGLEQGGGGDDRQQHGSGRRGWRSAAWLTSRGIKGEGEGDTDKWAPAIVQGGGVEFVSKLKFNRIQIKFKSIQTLADLKWTILSSKK
jgi:hypothetical protein